MKVLIIASYADSVLNFRGALIEKLSACGAIVHVVAPLEKMSEETLEKGRGVVQGDRWHNVNMKRVGVNPLRDVQTFWQIYWVIRKVKPDIVLGYTVKPVIWGGMAAWLYGVPKRFALITGAGYVFIDERGFILKNVVRFLYRFALARTEKVFFQNPDDEIFFRRTNMLPRGTPSCVVNGSGVDVAEYSSAALPGRGSFLLIARLLRNKGVREYAEAARKVKSLYPNARFQLVGWIDENPDAISQSELDSWIESGTLEYMGKLADVRPAIADCDVYVLPSYREGTPRTVLEAMAMGRAIITTDAPGCRETVVDGENGFLVPIKDSAALAEAMLRCIEHPEEVAAMGAASRQIAENKYDVDKVNQVMLKEMGIL